MTQGLPTSETVTVNGEVVEYVLMGQGQPVMILLNGFRMPLTAWEKIVPALSQEGQVLAYNRSGVGSTSKASSPQTGKAVVNTLEELLQTLHLAPPYILIAHSVGGIFANLYARMHPQGVAGMVLVDAAHPEEPQRQAAFQPPRVIRFLMGALRAIETYFDPYKYSEDERISETVQQLHTAGPFPPIPLAVVSGGKKMPLVPEESFQVHQQCQRELATLSPQAVHIVAKQSGHFPQVTEPDIVIRAVQEVLANVQTVSVADG